jgi:hypothetical protein
MTSSLILEALQIRLINLEKHLPDSPLVYYAPDRELQAILDDVCRAYLAGAPAERAGIRSLFSEKPGLINRLLAYVYASPNRFSASEDAAELRKGLAAAAIRGNGPDFRDFYLALAKLFLAFESAGLDPESDAVVESSRKNHS